MHRITLGPPMALLCLALATPPAFAASTSPGANAAFESATAVPLAPPSSVLLTASITKGKKKKVLAVEAMYTDGNYSPTPAAPRVLHLLVDVNGILMEPTVGLNGAIEDCGFAAPPPVACTITGSWWLDIDANPVLINAPLTITLKGGDISGGPLVGFQLMDVSLSVNMTKK